MTAAIPPLPIYYVGICEYSPNGMHYISNGSCEYCSYSAPRTVEAAAPEMAKGKGALGIQVGGSHYKDMGIQPVEYILANNLGFIEGAVIKYVSRWKAKNGVEDLRKARHFLDMLIENEVSEDVP